MKRLTLFAFAAAALLSGCYEAAHMVATKKIYEEGPLTPVQKAAPLTVIERSVSSGGEVTAKLSNGLVVIVKPVRTAPVVCVQSYVRAGGLYEREWLGCGISHLVEHLVAEGAEHDMGAGTAEEAKQTSDRVQEIGGQSNAYTSMDHTCYYISAAAGKTNDCIDLIADWMARPEITQEDFDREHGVVQRELELGKDDPDRQMWQMFSDAAFGTHPAAVPVIGLAGPLSRLTRDDVLAYHARMYVPQNMIFVVVGDVDAEAVLDRCCEAFAGFESGKLPDLTLPEVQPTSGVRRIVCRHKEMKQVEETIGFHTIPLLHKDLYALDVLSYILSEGRSSRLVDKLDRRMKLVVSISSGSWTPSWGAGQFEISFRCEPQNVAAAEQAVLDELRSVIENGVTEEELARAKRQKHADMVYSQQTADSQAKTLATDYMSTGDIEFTRNYTRLIQSVTAEQVQLAAAKYFDFSNMIIARMVPADTETKAGDVKAVANGKAEFFTLAGGLRVILQPTDAGLVSMSYVSRGGLLLEDDKTNGLGNLMASLSTRGAGERTAEDIDKFFANAGGGISGSCGNNSFYWQATVLDDSFATALEILADVVQRPAYTQKELDIIRPKLLAALDSIGEDWGSELQKYFREQFFTNSPYGMLTLGNADVIKSATIEQIKAWHKKCTGAENSVLAIYGSFDPAGMKEKLEKLFPPAAAQQISLPDVAQRKVAEGGELHVLKTQKQIAAVMVAVPGMKVTDLEDCFAINVLDTIISGYQLPAGWLHNELRGKQLVYVVHAYNWAGLEPGAFCVYAAGQPENARQVVDIIKKNLARAASYTPSQKEIDQAVNVILTAELLGNQDMSSLAMSAALDELYGFGYDFRRKLEGYYRKITPADVRRVGEKYLGAAPVVVVTTPDPELLEIKTK